MNTLYWDSKYKSLPKNVFFKKADGQAHCIYSNHKNKYKHKDFTSRICVKSVNSIFHLLATNTEVQRSKSGFFFVEASFSNLVSVSSYHNTFVVWRSGSHTVLAYHKGSVTISQRIRGYTSIMDILKFTYILIKGIMSC